MRCRPEVYIYGYHYHICTYPTQVQYDERASVDSRTLSTTTEVGYCWRQRSTIRSLAWLLTFLAGGSRPVNRIARLAPSTFQLSPRKPQIIGYLNSRDEEYRVQAEEERTDYLHKNGSVTLLEPTWTMCRLQQLLLQLSGFIQHRGVVQATSSSNCSHHRLPRSISRSRCSASSREKGSDSHVTSSAAHSRMAASHG